MPQSRTSSRTALSRLLFLAVLGWALVALGRRTSEETEGTFAAAELGGTPMRRPRAAADSVRARGAREGEARHEPRVRNPLLRRRGPRPAPATCSSARWSRRRPRAKRPRPPKRRPTTRPPARRHPPRIRPRLPPRIRRRPRRRPTTARRPPRATSPPTPARPPIPATARARRDDRPRRRAHGGTR